MNDEYEPFQGDKTNGEKATELLLLLALMFGSNMEDSEEFQGDDHEESDGQ